MGKGPDFEVTWDNFRRTEDGLKDPERLARWAEGDAELTGFRIPTSVPDAPPAVRALTDEERAEVAKFGMSEEGYVTSGAVLKDLTPEHKLVFLHLVRSSLTAGEIEALMTSWALANAVLGVQENRTARQRLELWGLDPDGDPNNSAEVRRGYWLALFQRLLKFGMDEDEARTWAKSWRSMLELPPRPNTIHASIVLEMAGKQRTLHQARVRVKAMLYPFEQWGGAIPLNLETISYTDPAQGTTKP